MGFTSAGTKRKFRGRLCFRGGLGSLGSTILVWTTFALLPMVSATPLDASMRERGRIWPKIIPDKSSSEPELPTAYLAKMGEPPLIHTLDAGDPVPVVRKKMHTSPTFAAFRERYDQIIEAENRVPVVEEVEDEPEVVAEAMEPKRRMVVRSEFDIEDDVPGAFPRPERDTLSFEDIYLFFPVDEGDAKKVGLVRGEGNRSIFSPPASSGLKSGVTFETISR